jgi:hypothetical protein
MSNAQKWWAIAAVAYFISLYVLPAEYKKIVSFVAIAAVLVEKGV